MFSKRSKMEDLINNNVISINISGVKKQYRLGQIGGGTLQADLQSWWAKKRGKEDPNRKIGQKERLVGKSFMALNGIDLIVYKGEALGIIGGNGAGKSTLLKLLSQVTAPTEGTIELYGRVASMLEVGTGFNGEMTGRENIYMNGAILGMTRQEIDAKIEKIIDFSEVREFIDTPVKRYSSGMYVKLAFSVAAHLDSEIMIMDEVLAVGDVAFQKKCIDKMRAVANEENRTVLYVSHNMNTIRQLCDRCVVLNQGRIIYIGEVEEAIEHYLGTSGVMATEYHYLPEFHSNPLSSDEFEIKDLTVVNSSDMRFNSGDRIELKIHIISKIQYTDLKFRFEIQYQDGTSVGTAILDNSFSTNKNDDKEIFVSFDTSHLPSGKYRVDIIAFAYLSFAAQRFIDGVFPGFSFEINQESDITGGLLWSHQYWGNVRLHDSKLIQVEA